MSSFPPAPVPARSPTLSSPNASTPIQPPPTSLPPLFSSSPPPPSTPAPAPSPALSSHNATAPPPSSPLQPPPLNSPAPAPSPSQPPPQTPLHGGGVALPPPPPPPPSTRFKFRPPYRPPTYLPPPPPPGASGSLSAKGVSMGIISVGTMVGVILIAIIIVLVVVCFRKGKNNQDAPPSPPPMGRLYNPPPRKLNPKPGVEGIPKPWNPFSPKSQLTSIHVDSFSTSSENLYSPKTTRFSSGNFTIEELAASTANFSPQNLLGEGGFGYVHKGVLPNGRRIAVKRLKLGSRQGEREFQAEVETISRVHHKNLVSMLGYCMTGAERSLVYEFVPNNTLEFHLHGKDQPVMKWATRMKIAIGSAKGLAYLHEDCNPTIIHRDIKASNILLDSKFEAKVADFGLAKFFSDANHDITHVYTRVVGTFGYLAPEYAASGRASDKSDVFSFGVMLLELITGRKPLSTTDCLLSWARPLLKQAMENRNFDALVDPRLQKDYNSEEMATMVACAAACVRNSEWRRPRMSQIIRTLEGDVSLSDIDEGIKPGHSTIYDVLGTPYLD